MIDVARAAGLLCLLTMTAAPQQKIIFDTDSGLFGDDGASLVMLLRSPAAISIQGIAVVSGNVWAPQGAEYMFRILKLLGHPSVPLYMGARMPLVHTPAMAEAEARRWGPLAFRGAFAEPFPDSSRRLLPPSGGKFAGIAPQKQNAVDFLIESIQREPGGITVLELGPMTNLAMALRLRPDLASKIRMLVFMGGNVRVPGNASPSAEFNFWFDPEAAQVVLRSKIPRKVMFSLDVTNRAAITRREFDQIVSVDTPITALYREDSGNRYPGFLKDPKAIGYLWDELAALWLLDPSFITASEKMYLDVNTRFGPNYGQAVALDRSLAPEASVVEVMLDLNFPRAFAMYKELLTRAK